jgi:hypothetical protein
MGPSGSGLKMIRTIWLATICLAVLSTLAVGKALMTRNPSSATEPTDRTTIGTDLIQDALGKADRLEITYVRQEVPAATVLQPMSLWFQPLHQFRRQSRTRSLAGTGAIQMPSHRRQNQNKPSKRPRARRGRSLIEKAIKLPIVPSPAKPVEAMYVPRGSLAMIEVAELMPHQLTQADRLPNRSMM